MKFVLDIILKAIPRVLPLFFVTLVSGWLRLVFAGLYLIVLGLSDYYFLIRPEAHLRHRVRAVMDFHIGGWVSRARYYARSQDAAVFKRPLLRVNVMLISPSRMRMSRWLWNHGFPDWIVRLMESRLIQVYEYGMSGHPDANLSWAINRGFCGQCLLTNRKETAYLKLQGVSENQIRQSFALSVEDYQQTKHITAITSTTLVRKVKRLFGRELPEDEYFGVLNIDAVDDIGALFLEQPKILEQIRALSVIVEAIYE